jgi:hypothetical protein
MPCRWLNRTGFLTGSGHHPHVNYFSFFPVVFTSSKRFALQNVALASLPCASGSFWPQFRFAAGCSSSFQEQKRFC